MKILSWNISFFLLLTFSCAGVENKKASEPSVSFNAYWYSGQAEVSSYKLNQARYGEIHQGTAVLVFVTESFSKDKNTKSDQKRESDIPVLKLNFSKKFNMITSNEHSVTGI